jgi:hypothetical protein
MDRVRLPIEVVHAAHGTALAARRATVRDPIDPGRRDGRIGAGNVRAGLICTGVLRASKHASPITASALAGGHLSASRSSSVHPSNSAIVWQTLWTISSLESQNMGMHHQSNTPKSAIDCAIITNNHHSTRYYVNAHGEETSTTAVRPHTWQTQANGCCTIIWGSAEPS